VSKISPDYSADRPTPYELDEGEHPTTLLVKATLTTLPSVHLHPSIDSFFEAGSNNCRLMKSESGVSFGVPQTPVPETETMNGIATFPEIAGPVIGCDRRRIDAIFSSQIIQELRLSIPSDRRMIYPVVSMLQDFCERIELLNQREQMRAGVALEEALTNAVVHGNLEVSSKLRELNDGSYEKLIALRLGKSPYQHRIVEVTARYSDSDVSFVIRDEGPGFDVSSIPDPTDDGFVSRPHGRGLLLMRSFMDEVKHNATGNQVTLIKRRRQIESLPVSA
jgi:anti-sigma regulatory factor (Ser/Thr protein kinase)